jgi:hypothetical protein
MAGLCLEGHNSAMREKGIAEKLRRFGGLSPAEKRLFVKAVYWLAVARVRLAMTPLEKLASGSVGVANGKPDAELLRRVGRAVDSAGANMPWRSDCFPRAIAARSLLKGLGYSSTIHLGVDRVGDSELAGHAWVTCGDTVVVGGAELDRYTEVHRLGD